MVGHRALVHMVVAVMERDIRRGVVEMEHRNTPAVGEEDDRIGLAVDSGLVEEGDLQEGHRKVVVEGKVVVDDNLGVEDVPEEDMRRMAALFESV